MQFYLLRMYACQGLCCFPSTSAFGFVIESINETESDTTCDGGSAREFYTVDEKTEVFISGVTGSTKPAEQQVVSSEASSGAGGVKAKGGVTEVGGLDSIYSQLLGIIQDPVVHADVLAISTSLPSSHSLFVPPFMSTCILFFSFSSQIDHLISYHLQEYRKYNVVPANGILLKG